MNDEARRALDDLRSWIIGREMITAKRSGQTSCAKMHTLQFVRREIESRLDDDEETR